MLGQMKNKFLLKPSIFKMALAASVTLGVLMASPLYAQVVGNNQQPIRQVGPLNIEAEKDPKSILFPSNLPGAYFPNDDEIARAAEARLNVPLQDNLSLSEAISPFMEKIVTIEDVLGEEDKSAYGTISRNAGGFSKNIWQPSTLKKSEMLLKALTLPSTSPAMDEISRKLILSVTTAPTGKAIKSEMPPEMLAETPFELPEPQFDQALLNKFINLRTQELIERGNLLDLVDFIQNLPDGTLAINQQNTEILMLGGDLIGACEMTALARNANASSPSFMAEELSAQEVFWLKMTTFCRIMEGDLTGAQIALDLLNEQSVIDFIFHDLSSKLMEDPEVRLPFLSVGLTSLDPLNYTMLSLLDQPIEAELIENSSPLILSALVINPNMPAENRFQAAVKSNLSGGVSLDVLRSIYDQQLFSEMEYQNAVRMAEFDNRPLADVLLYQAASRQATDFDKVTTLEVIWKRALENNDLPRKARLNVETLKSIIPSSRLMNHAHHITRGLLLAGEKERAIEWYNFVRGNAVSGDAEATRALINIWPLLILADGSGEIPWSNDILDLWWNGQMVLSPENRDSRATLFYALAEAFQNEVSDDKWAELITENSSENARSVPLGVWREIIRAVGDNKPSEAIILSLIAMGKEGPGSLDPAGISTIVRLLRSFGLDQEARDVALEALVANDF